MKKIMIHRASISFYKLNHPLM